MTCAGCGWSSGESGGERGGDGEPLPLPLALGVGVGVGAGLALPEPADGAAPLLNRELAGWVVEEGEEGPAWHAR